MNWGDWTMLIFYQVVLILIIFLGVLAVVAEQKNEKIRDRMFVITIVSIVSFLITTKWFG